MKQNIVQVQLCCGDRLLKLGTLIVLTGVLWLTSSAWHLEESLAQEGVGSTRVGGKQGQGGTSVPGGPEEIECPQAGKIAVGKKVERYSTEEVEVAFIVPPLNRETCWCWKNSTGSTDKLIDFHQSLKDKLKGRIESEGFFLDDRETIKAWDFYAKRIDTEFFRNFFGFEKHEFFRITLPAGQPSMKGPKKGEEITCVSKEGFKEYIVGLAPVLDWLLSTDRLLP